KRLPQHLGQARDRCQYSQRVTMHHYEPGVGIHLVEPIPREDMVGTLENPVAPCSVLMLQMLQEALVEAIGLEMAGIVEPLRIRRNVMGGVEAEALQNLSGDFNTFLRRVCLQGMQAGKLRSESAKRGELTGHDSPAPVDIIRISPAYRIWENRLPASRNGICGIPRHKVVQESRSASWQPEDENRSIDALPNDCPVLELFRTKGQQI